MGHWIILLDCSNAFDSTKRAGCFKTRLQMVPTCTPFVGNDYGVSEEFIPLAVFEGAKVVPA